MALSKIFDSIGVWSFLTFLCKDATYADFKQNEDKEDLQILLVFSYIKLANISTLSLITFTGISETWEALSLFS